MRVLSRRVALATTLSLVATGVTAMSEAANAQPVTTTPSGLKIIDLKVGTGPSTRTETRAKSLTVHSIVISRSHFRSASIRSLPAGTKVSHP